MISDKYKFIFLHHGKCGGVSVKRSLVDKVKDCYFKQSHPKLKEMEAEIIKKGFSPSDYLKFTIIRNPWDRCVSMYYHLITKKLTTKTFDEIFYDDEEFRSVKSLQFHLEEMDFVLKLEGLQSDYDSLCDRLGLPRSELSHHDHATVRPSKNYREYYTDKMKDHVAKRNQEVIDKYEYTF